MEPEPEDNSELESFRRQWLSDLRSKKPEPAAPSQQRRKSVAGSSKAAARAETVAKPSASAKHQVDDDEDYLAHSHSFDEPAGMPSSSGGKAVQLDESVAKGPVSALDHYERGVEKENIGSLGDSLTHYRKAFKMDSRVDLLYRKKHFPSAMQKPGQSSSNPPETNPSDAAAAAASAVQHPHDGPPRTLSELIASFADLGIASAPPEIEGTPAPPCPIAGLPGEILVHVLTDVAVLDVGDFVRLAQVCKRFAFVAVTEQQIWRRVCLGGELGFPTMHYHWQRGVTWEPLLEEEEEDSEGQFVTMEEVARKRREESFAVTNTLFSELYSSSWLEMFRHRPRIRFNGCYISTVNYIRAGQASVHAITWNNPVHIVTYYRYLRFFRDGTVISLLTTSEPADVVHHMTKELLFLHQKGGQAFLPSIVMQSGLRGRWRLSSALDNPDAPLKEMEGDLFIETEGVGTKYLYRMEMSLRSAGKAARNNKLVWRSFHSYNKLTDDSGEFTLKNYKPFFFSRVKSYGLGE